MTSRTATERTARHAARTASKRSQRTSARKRQSIEAAIGATDRVVAKRRAQLEAAMGKRAELSAKLARLDVPDGLAGPVAYCIKERRRVQIGGAHAIVLANGRPAIAGTCPSCGSKLVRIGAS